MSYAEFIQTRKEGLAHRGEQCWGLKTILATKERSVNRGFRKAHDIMIESTIDPQTMKDKLFDPFPKRQVLKGSPTLMITAGFQWKDIVVGMKD